MSRITVTFEMELTAAAGSCSDQRIDWLRCELNEDGSLAPGSISDTELEAARSLSDGGAMSYTEALEKIIAARTEAQ